MSGPGSVGPPSGVSASWTSLRDDDVQEFRSLSAESHPYDFWPMKNLPWVSDVAVPASRSNLVKLTAWLDDMKIDRLQTMFALLTPADIKTWVHSMTSASSALSDPEKQKLFAILADKMTNSRLVLMTDELRGSGAPSARNDVLMLGNAINANPLAAHKKFDYFIELKTRLDESLVPAGWVGKRRYELQPEIILMGRFLVAALADKTDDPTSFDRMLGVLGESDLKKIVRAMFGREVETEFGSTRVVYQPKELQAFLAAVVARADLSLECGALRLVNAVHRVITQLHPDEDKALEEARILLVDANINYNQRVKVETEKFGRPPLFECKLLSSEQKQALEELAP